MTAREDGWTFERALKDPEGYAAYMIARGEKKEQEQLEKAPGQFDLLPGETEEEMINRVFG